MLVVLTAPNNAHLLSCVLSLQRLLLELSRSLGMTCLALIVLPLLYLTLLLSRRAGHLAVLRPIVAWLGGLLRRWGRLTVRCLGRSRCWWREVAVLAGAGVRLLVGRLLVGRLLRGVYIGYL